MSDPINSILESSRKEAENKQLQQVLEESMKSSTKPSTPNIVLFKLTYLFII